MWAASACARELPFLMSRPVKDFSMSPWPVWLFTGCPLPSCQPELGSSLTAHGDERHSNSKTKINSPDDSSSSLVFAYSAFSVGSYSIRWCLLLFLTELLRPTALGESNTTHFCNIRLMHTYIFIHSFLPPRPPAHHAHGLLKSSRGCSSVGSLSRYTPT